jgi:tetratricopeptide (TPR) repeat protein
VKIFVSYSRRDAGDFADQVQRHLSNFQYNVFTDVNSIMAGEVWSKTIEENISNCDIFVVIVTHGALQSPHVEREVLQAQKEKKKIIPCFFRGINPTKIKWEMEKIQGVEFSDKYELARDLYSKINNETYIPSTIKKSKKKISITVISFIVIIALVIGIVVFQTQPFFPSPMDDGNIGSTDKDITQPEPNVDTLFSSGLSNYNIRQYSEAVSSFDKVLQIEPNNVTAQYLKGSSLYNQGNYSEAVSSFDKVLQIEPNNVTAQYLKGFSQYKQEDYSDAHQSFQQILQINANNTDALNYDGLSLYNLERYNEAILQFNRLLATEPTNINALLYKGLSLYNLERYNEAILQFNRLLATEPTNINALLYKGLSLYNLERYNEAAAYYDKVLEIDPANMNATKEKEKIQQIQQNRSTNIQ